MRAHDDTTQPPAWHSTAAQLALRYADALDDGDLDTIALVLEAALDDPELSRLVGEIDLAVHEELALSPLAADAATVRTLLRRHLPSAFPEPSASAQLTVGQVAARLIADRLVPAADQAASAQLAASGEPVPTRLTRAGIAELAGRLGMRLSERFWERFRDAAITVAMGRAQSQVGLAATRRVYAPRARGVAEDAAFWPEIDTRALARRIYADAGLDFDAAQPAIVPLRDLTASYPIRVIEVPGLTYRRAADTLLKETGVRIEVPTSDVPLAGFLCCVLQDGELLGCVVINADDPIVRRRFSEAHELAHYVRHFLPLQAAGDVNALFWEGLTWPGDDGALPAGHLSASEGLNALAIAPTGALGPRAEEEANALAAELLMPEAACRAAVARDRAFAHQPALLVRRLAGTLLVSRQAMQRRLAELGLLPAGRE